MATTALPMTNISTQFTTVDTGYPFSWEVAAFVAALLGAMAIFGIVANTLTIIVIAKSNKLRSVFSIFIISLCASDLGSSLVSPIFIYRRTWGFNDWDIPYFFCSFSWCIHMWTNYVTSVHIVCFAALRLCAISRPIKFREIQHRHAQMCIVVIWLICFLVGGVPLAVWFGVEDRESGIVGKHPACGVRRHSLDAFNLYKLIAYPIFFYLPIVLVTGISIAVGVSFFQRRKEQKQKFDTNLSSAAKSVSNELTTAGPKNGVGPQAKKKKKSSENEAFAILQLVLIVGSFLLGYLPFTIYQLYSYTETAESKEDYVSDWNFGIAEYILLRFSECLNPVFYNLASKTMRDETFRLVKAICCWCCTRRGNR